MRGGIFSQPNFLLSIIINENCETATVNATANKVVDEIISINGLLENVTFYLLPGPGNYREKFFPC